MENMKSNEKSKRSGKAIAGKLAPLTLMIAYLLAVFSLAAPHPCAAATPSATPTDLGVLSGYDNSEAEGINASGQVVGYSWTESWSSEMPCTWQPGDTTPTELPLPDGSAGGEAWGINDSGVVVGGCWMTETEDYQTCRWQFVGGEWTVTPLGVPDGYSGSYAYAINENGQILAEARTEDGWTYVGCVWDGSWKVMKYGDTPIDLLTYNTPQIRISENGQALGLTGDGDLVLWDNSTSSATFIVPIIDNASLNSLGQVVGWYYDEDAGEESDFVYDPSLGLGTGLVSDEDGLYFGDINDNGQVIATSPTEYDEYNDIIATDIVLLDFNDGSETTLGSVPGDVIDCMLNANGEVAGNYYSNMYESFYASADGVVLLNALEEDRPAFAVAINDSGLIAGYGYTASDTEHAVMWGEVAPPPSALTISDVTVTSPNPHSPNITVTVQISNPSDTDTAYDVTVTSANLGGVDSNSALPLVYGAIQPGTSKKCTLHFKNVPKSSQTLMINGTSSLGDFYTTQTVNVP